MRRRRARCGGRWTCSSSITLPGERGRLRASRASPSIAAHRGTITDRYGEPLAVSTPVDSIWANPQELALASDQIQVLAKALKQDASGAHAAHHQQPRPRVPLSRAAPAAGRGAEDQGARHSGRLSDARVPPLLPLGRSGGPHSRLHQRRRRGAGRPRARLRSLARGRRRREAHHPGSLRPRACRTSRAFAPRARAAISMLSIDLRIQYLAYRELKAAIRKQRARAGSVVVLDVATRRSARDGEPARLQPQRSRADCARRPIATAPRPTSSSRARAIKPFVVAAGLIVRQIHRPQHHRHLARLSQGRRTGSSRRSTAASAASISRRSSRRAPTSAWRCSRCRSSREQMWNTLTRLGFGQVTTSGYPGRVRGPAQPLLALAPGWRSPRCRTATGSSVTPLQLAHAYATVGALGVQRPDLVPARGSSRCAGERVIDARICARPRSTCSKPWSPPKGTGKRAAIPGYRVSGKTGTAWKATAGGYSTDRYMAVFGGVAPATNPRLAAVVVIDEPGAGRYYGGEVAAPVFSEVDGRRAAPARGAAGSGRAAAERSAAADRAARQRRRRRCAMNAAARISLAELTAGLVAVPAGIVVTDVTLDSRAATPGALFLACRGRTHHGLEFAQQAVARGARAVLYEDAADAQRAFRTSARRSSSPRVPELSRHVGTIADRFFGAPSQALTRRRHHRHQRQDDVRVSARAGAECAAASPPPTPARWATACPERCTPSDAHDVRCGERASPARSAARASARAASAWKCPRTRSIRTRRWRALPHRRVHQSHARPSRLSRHDGGVRRREGAAVRLAGAACCASSTSTTRSAHELAARPSQARLVVTSRRLCCRTTSRRRAREFVRATRVQAQATGLIDRHSNRAGATASSSVPLIGDFNVDNVLTVLAVLLAWDVPLAEAAPRARAMPARRAGAWRAFGGGDGSRSRSWTTRTRRMRSARRCAPRARIAPAGCTSCSAAAAIAMPASVHRWARIAAELADEVVITDDNPRTEDPQRIVADIRAGIAAVARRARRARPRAARFALALGSAARRRCRADRRQGSRGLSDLRHASAAPFSDQAVVRELLRRRRHEAHARANSRAPAAVGSTEPTARIPASPPTRARSSRASCSSRCAGRTSTATNSSARPLRPRARRARWSMRSSAVALLADRRRRHADGARAARRARWREHVLHPVDRRRGQQRQDHRQGDDRRDSRAGRAVPRDARQSQQSHRRAADAAAAGARASLRRHRDGRESRRRGRRAGRTSRSPTVGLDHQRGRRASRRLRQPRGRGARRRRDGRRARRRRRSP